jgi:hypothetical protein
LLKRLTMRPLALVSYALLTIASITLSAACAEDGASRRAVKPRGVTPGADGNPTGSNDIFDPAKEGFPDPVEGLKHGTEQNEALCTRVGIQAGTTNGQNEPNPAFNAVTAAFCRDRKSIGSLVELQKALGLGFEDTAPNATNGSNGNPGFALSGHSTSLLARSVSAINPRAFIFSAPAGQPTRIPGFVVMGFARGEPFVEIAAEQAKGGKLTFYLAKVELACGESCSHADLLTPAVEKNWKGVTIYDDEDLKNTIVDCRHCHQSGGGGGGGGGGANAKMMLRMQELEDPWTHWFRSDRPGGLALMQDYFRAHGQDEEYGGIPGRLINKSDGRALEDLVKGQGFDDQPNAFNSRTIERETQTSSNLQPLVNTPRGQSQTWKTLYDRAFAGEFIPVPYHDVKVTDPNKLQYATDEYKKVMNKQSNTLPDIRRVFLDEALDALTFYPKQGATGREVLVQTCAQCHNPKLDQSLSRARFDVTKLDSMSQADKQKVIERLKLPASNILHMPPAMMRSLPDDALEAAVQELSK